MSENTTSQDRIWFLPNLKEFKGRNIIAQTTDAFQKIIEEGLLKPWHIIAKTEKELNRADAFDEFKPFFEEVPPSERIGQVIPDRIIMALFEKAKLPPSELDPILNNLRYNWWTTSIPVLNTSIDQRYNLATLKALVEAKALPPDHPVKKGRNPFYPAGFYPELRASFKESDPDFFPREKKEIPVDYDPRKELKKLQAPDKKEKKAVGFYLTEYLLQALEEAPPPPRPKKPKPGEEPSEATPAAYVIDEETHQRRYNMFIKASIIGLWSACLAYIPILVFNFGGIGVSFKSHSQNIVLAVLLTIIGNFVFVFSRSLAISNVLGWIHDRLDAQDWNMTFGVFVGGGLGVLISAINGLTVGSKPNVSTIVAYGPIIFNFLTCFMLGLLCVNNDWKLFGVNRREASYDVGLTKPAKIFMGLVTFVIVLGFGWEYHLINKQQFEVTMATGEWKDQGLLSLDFIKGRYAEGSSSTYIVEGEIINNTSQVVKEWSCECVLVNFQGKVLRRAVIKNGVQINLAQIYKKLKDWYPVDLDDGMRKRMANPESYLQPNESRKFKFKFYDVANVYRYKVYFGEDAIKRYSDFTPEFLESLKGM